MRTLLLLFGFYVALSSALFAANGDSSASTGLIREDRSGERALLKKEAYDDLSNGAFDALEKRATDLGVNKTRFPEGTYELPAFYGGLSAPFSPQPTDVEWQDHIKKLQAWRTAKPDSVLAATFEGWAWVNYAWFARGTGYANTVTPEGGKLLVERLEKARKILDETYAKHDRKDIPPGWYSAYLVVGLGQGWTHTEFDKWFDEAVAKDSDYEEFYFTKAYYLLPRWYGQDGDAEKFAESCGQTYGPECYTRICWSLSSYYPYKDFFSATQTQWPLMKTGFEAMEKRWPTSLWNLNNFCHFACLAGDKETAHRLFLRIGDQNYAAVWGWIKPFIAYKKWAKSPGDSPPPEPE